MCATKKLTVTVYSDIHHDLYTNGLSIDDSIAVERQVLEEARKHHSDLILFLGDRFRSRNPFDEAKTLADAALKEKNDSGIPILCLVGNHDRYTRSAHSGHNFKFVDFWQDRMPLVLVMDKRATYPVVLEDGRSVAVHAIPADHELSVAPLVPAEGFDFQVCLFHNLLLGATLQNGRQATEGLAPEMLDLEWLDLVLGGDNHRHQRLSLTRTTGWYAGAAMQHNWGDCGEVRGISTFAIEKDGGEAKVTHLLAESVSPKFVSVAFGWSTDSAFWSDVESAKAGLRGNIVKVTLSGDEKSLIAVPRDDIKDVLVKSYGCRSAFVVLDVSPGNQTVASPAGPPVVRTPMDAWSQYVKTGAVNANGLDVGKLEAIGIEILSEVL